MNARGLTMVEVTISLVILTIAVFGLGYTTARLTRVAVTAEARALALQEAEDRVSRIQLHPEYHQLDSVFSESGTAVPWLPGHTRTTSVQRVLLPGRLPGRFIDFTRVTVTVDGPGLSEPVSRTVAIGAS